MENIEHLEGYNEIRRKLIEEMPIEDRLWGLTPEELLPALPLEVLRVLPADYLAAFPAEVREKVKQRLGRRA